MIIKQSRFKRINGKIYDIGTKNTSWIKLATDLKRAGVKQWYFMLEIKDVSLGNVNPYAVDEKTGKSTLSRDQIDRVIYECVQNPWYYLREISRIPDPGSPVGIEYRANRGNIAQAWCLLHGIDSWLCLPRQQGKTQSALAIQLWAYTFGTSNATFIFINKDGENAKENLQRMKDQIECLPEYLRFEAVMDDEDGKITKATKNATKMQHPVTKNKIIVKAKATSHTSALNLARGLTAPILHFDEPEFTEHILTIVDNSVSTFDTAARRSKENGKLYGRIFTCTPGDLDTKPGMESQILLSKTVEWTEEMYTWDKDKIDSYVNKKESNRIVYIEYSYRAIGLTEHWFSEITAKMNDPITVRREILLQRLKGSSLSPYDREDVEDIINKEKAPIDKVFLQSYYPMHIYEELNKKIPYIVGVDCSTGTSGDNQAFTVLNPYTMKPAAEFECPYAGETLYELILQELVIKYIPRAILCIERNSIGDAIVDHLMNSRISTNLYYDKEKDLMNTTMKDYESVESMLRSKAKEKTFIGVWTGGTSRDAMFTILARHVKEYRDHFVTKNITRDLSRLIRKPTGRIEAMAPHHDDSIMSYLIAMYVYYHGNNLDVFGFNKGDTALDNLNQGIDRPDLDESDIDNTELDDDVKDLFRAEINKQNHQDNYEDRLRAAMYRAQAKNRKLQEKNLMDSNEDEQKMNSNFGFYDGLVDDEMDDGLFDTLNNMDGIVTQQDPFGIF